MQALPHSTSLPDGHAPPADHAIDQLAALTAQRDREMLDVSLAQGVMELLGANSVGVYRLLGQEGEARHWMCGGLARPGQLTISDSPWADVDTLSREADHPARQQVLNSRALTQSELPCTTVEDASHRFVAVLPLMVELGSPGVLEVHTDKPLPPGALRPIQTLLKVFANFQNLLESSQRDSLTGLLNRQSFDATFMKATMPIVEEGAAERGGSERRTAPVTGYWLGVVDIDHFKRVNDGFGHLIGDEVLVLLARIMRQSFRHYDRLYRFGGEEFVVLLRAGSEEDAMGAFERFRLHVMGYPFPQVQHVTVSIGVSAVQHHETPNGAFSRADQAVYQAKHQGRNQVLCYEAEVRSGAMQSEQSHIGDVELF
jgi:diguanylate cyclase (GGDEF)-like protein